MPNNKPQAFTALRDFPSVEILAGDTAWEPFVAVLTRPVVVNAIKAVIADLKEQFRSEKKTISEADLMAAVRRELETLSSLRLEAVLNGTGIIIHTNLGRAPISRAMLDAATGMLTGYSNLEFDLATGRRGRRGELVEKLLAALCGTAAGTLVNNTAAALFIILNTLAGRREVIISRGELVQIGGGFRIPDIMAKSGVRLVEVGTTNRTSLDDYTRAITDKTRMILKVHRSNFTQTGFVEETALADLAGLCHERGLILTHDLGSGLIAFPTGINIADEPSVAESVRVGTDLTCFSGDKLLGGAQAGLIVGRTDLIAAIKKNPLYRTVRCDKFVFAITTQVLSAHLNGTQTQDIPIWHMITIPVTELKRRGEAIKNACRGKDVAILATQAFLGGGSTPGGTIPSLALSIRSSLGPDRLAKRFRAYTPPIIGRVESDDFLIDLRTIPADQDALLISAITSLVE
jgi:L-seryl-tRNA(Ser) seleniumtransferase